MGDFEKSDDSSSKSAMHVDESDDAAPDDDASAFTVAVVPSAEIIYKLFNSGLLDFGSAMHLTNSHDRFIEYHPYAGNRTVLCGGGHLAIIGYGTFNITVRTTTGRTVIRVEDGYYVPCFPTSVISYDQIERKNLFWEPRFGRLMREKDGRSKLPQHGGARHARPDRGQTGEPPDSHQGRPAGRHEVLRRMLRLRHHPDRSRREADPQP